MTITRTCAGLLSDGRNGCCEKRAECARYVCWYDDLRAAFNLCSPHGSGTFRHYAPNSMASQLAEPNPSRHVQQELFA